MRNFIRKLLSQIYSFMVLVFIGGLVFISSMTLLGCSKTSPSNCSTIIEHPEFANDLLQNDLPDGYITCINNADEYYHLGDFVYDYQADGRTVKFINQENRTVFITNMSCYFEQIAHSNNKS